MNERNDSIASPISSLCTMSSARCELSTRSCTSRSMRFAPFEAFLTGVPERRMPGVVAEPDRLDEILVQSQRASDDPGDRGCFECVRHPRAVVIAGGVDEDLGLALQPAKWLRVDDPIAVTL